LGISYPTVRGKLDAVIRGLGFEIPTKDTIKDRELKEATKIKILDQLSKSEITAKEAIEKIKSL
jgi:hypothetical protein